MIESEAIETLGIQSTGLNESVVRRAWKSLMLRFHPDKSCSVSSNDIAKRLNEAKDCLLRTLGVTSGVENFQDKDSFPQNRDYPTKKSRRRNPHVRVHAKLDSYEEGRSLIRDIETFFRDNFEECQGSHVYTRGILKRFVELRPGTSELEMRIFKRHCVRIFKSMWPMADHSRKNQLKCFRNVKFRQTHDSA